MQEASSSQLKIENNDFRINFECSFIFVTFQKCDFCTYMNVSSDKVVKHIALGHSKLDEMLQDEDLVQRKRALQSSKPKRENIGPSCPICEVRDPPREHVAR